MLTRRIVGFCVALAIGAPIGAQSQAAAPGAGLAGKTLLFTVDEPLDVPGAVLQQGTYMLRLKGEPQGQGANAMSRLEVLDARQTRVLAEFEAQHLYDPSQRPTSILVYYGSPSGRRVLQSWNLLPTNYSERLVYSPEEAKELSKLTSEPVFSMAPPPDQVAAAATPNDVVGGQPASAPAADRAQPDAAGEFPHTAGDLPIALWLGFTSLAAFVLFRIYRSDPVEARNARNHAVARRAAAIAYRSYERARSSAAEHRP